MVICFVIECLHFPFIEILQIIHFEVSVLLKADEKSGFAAVHKFIDEACLLKLL